MRTLLTLLAAASIATHAFAATDDNTAQGARVRPQDPRLIQLLRAGLTRSATLRGLVNRLEASNVIVYISLSQHLRSSLAGKLAWVTKAGGVRYLRATINAEQPTDQMIATLAHELQHAVEVSADDSVVDQRSLVALYMRIGRPSPAGHAASWDTEAAQDTGYQVRRELMSAAAEGFRPVTVDGVPCYA